MPESATTNTANAKIERKYLAHYIDSSFNGTAANYVRLGKDLEEYAIEMNPDSETKKNILGENSTNVKGYEPQGSVDPYYAYSGDPLYEHLASIINDRATGSALETTVVDALFKTDGSCEWAYRENAIISSTPKCPAFCSAQLHRFRLAAAFRFSSAFSMQFFRL